MFGLWGKNIFGFENSSYLQNMYERVFPLGNQVRMYLIYISVTLQNKKSLIFFIKFSWAKLKF